MAVVETVILKIAFKRAIETRQMPVITEKTMMIFVHGRQDRTLQLPAFYSTTTFRVHLRGSPLSSRPFSRTISLRPWSHLVSRTVLTQVIRPRRMLAVLLAGIIGVFIANGMAGFVPRYVMLLPLESKVGLRQRASKSSSSTSSPVTLL